jgi:hypothetical protein
VGAVAGAVAIAGCGDGAGLGRAPVRERIDAAAPLELRVGVTHAADALARRAVRARVRPSSDGAVDVRAALRLASGRKLALGSASGVELRTGRWQDVLVPLSRSGAAALSRCPAGRVAVTVADPRYTRTRAATGRLQLDPPDCARFFAPATYWNTPIPAGAALDANSAGVTRELRRQVEQGMRTTTARPTINTFVSAPPVLTVRAGQPKVRVHLDRPRGYAPQLASVFASVPLPADATPSAGSDNELILWQPATDTLWEFWRLRRASDGWHARWGGRLRHVSTGPALFTEPRYEAWGTSASGLPLAGGMMTPRELRRGVIDHALGLGIPSVRAEFYARPATRTDGLSKCLHAVPEGARFRLDPSLDVDSLHLPRVVAAMARAAQRYGIIVRDRSGAVSFYAQNVSSLPSNPYPELFGGEKPQGLVARFPWAHLQLLRMQLERKKGGGTLPAVGGCV